MDKDLKKFKKALKSFQELQNTENTNLTDFQKQTIDNFVNFAESYKLVEPLIIDNKNLKITFTPDIGLKYVISNISSSIILKMFNDIVNSNFDLSRKIDFKYTEYFDVTGDPDKMFIRGDISAKVDGFDALNNTVLIELQSTHRADIPSRVHNYGNNNLQRVKCEVNKNVNGEIKKVKEHVYVRPYELVIYTSTDFKQKEGYLRFNTSSNKFEFNGIKQSVENGDVITYLIPFVNIFQMTLEELNNSSLSFLQCIYLYKFKQDKSLIKDKVVIETAKAIEKNLRESLTEEDYDLVMRQFANIINDLCKELNNEPDKYKKEIEDMDYMATTFVGQIEMKARKEERKLAYQEKTNMVINMFKLNQSDENIHFVTQLPLEEIAQIRKANS